MKLNWGTSIAIFYSLFVVVMVFMVIKSMQNNVQLVQENYYDKDLNYEAYRQKRENAAPVPVNVAYNKSGKTIDLDFPPEMQAAKGKVVLFRPSNKFLDKTFDLKLDQQAKMTIPVDRTIIPGLWRIKIDWQADGMDFFKEKSIVI